MFELTAYAAVYGGFSIMVGGLDRLMNGKTLVSKVLLRSGYGVFTVAVLIGPVLRIGWPS